MITLAASDTIYGAAASASAVTYSIFGMQLNAGNPTWSKLAQGQFGTSASQLYISPSGTTTLISAIVLYNASSSAVNAQLFASGSSASNQLFNINVPAYGQAFIDQSGIQVNDGSGNSIWSVPTVISPNTPLATMVAAGTSGSEAAAARRDHTHYSLGGTASVNTVASVGVGPSSVVVGVIPANTLQVGTTLRMVATGVIQNGTNSPSSPSCYWTMGPCGIVGNGQVPNYNGSVIPPSDAYLLSGLSLPSASGSYSFVLHYVVTMQPGTGSNLQAIFSGYVKDSLGTIMGTPVFCTKPTSGQLTGQVNPAIANYITFTGMQYYSYPYGIIPFNAVLEILKA